MIIVNGPSGTSSMMKSAPPGGDAASRRILGLRVTWPLVAVQVVLHLVPWAIVLVLVWSLSSRGSLPPAVSPVGSSGSAVALSSAVQADVGDVSNNSGRVVLGPRGPWGQLEYTRIGIEMPSEFVFLNMSEQKQARWHFAGMSVDEVSTLLGSVDLDEALRQRLLDQGQWNIKPDGVTVTPGDDVILALKPEDRAKIYDTLVAFIENEAQRKAFAFRPAYFDERIEMSRLRPESIELLRGLLYPRHDTLLFADLVPALRQLPTREEQVRFVKTVSRKTSVLVKLRIMPDMNIDDVVDYWGVGGRSKDLAALLESLTRVQGGCSIDITHLLPGFARRRIYSFPTVTGDPTLAYQDCHWTAMNFFSDLPNDSFANLDYVSQIVASEYFQIAGPTQFGDLIFLTDAGGNVHHSAVFLADDLVFTKNGVSFTEPWTLMKLEDMVAVYNATRPPTDVLNLIYYRNKEL